MKEDFFESLENKNNIVECPMCGKETRRDLTTCGHCGCNLLMMRVNNHVADIYRWLDILTIGLGIILFFLYPYLNSDDEVTASFYIILISFVVGAVLFNKCVAEFLQILHDIRRKLYLNEKK